MFGKKRNANSPPPSPRPPATMEKCPFRTQSVIEIFACKTEIKFNYGCRLSLLIKRQRTRIFFVSFAIKLLRWQRKPGNRANVLVDSLQWVTAKF